jgi:hypothetical protein
MSFLPTNYTAPTSNSAYTKLEKGETRIRILSSAIFGYEVWKDRKPYRFRTPQEINVVGDIDEKTGKPRFPKEFLAFTVWNYKLERIEICEITQKGIISMLESFASGDDWGDPKDYDIKISRSGDGMDTKYIVMPISKKTIIEQIQIAFNETPVNLEALFDGLDPFNTPAQETEQQETEQQEIAEQVFDTEVKKK